MEWASWPDLGVTSRVLHEGKRWVKGTPGQPITETDKKINELIERIAKERGVSMATVAIAWSLSKPFITAPILGMSKKERVDEAIQAISFELSFEELMRIDDLYEPKKAFGF